MATHILKSGDTPWSLAVLYVKNGNRWPELCAANTNLKKHATYGCVFPKAGTAINLPASWVAGVSVATTDNSATITTNLPPVQQSLLDQIFGVKPTNVSIQTTSQTTTQPATASLTTTNSNPVPAATNTTIPSSASVNASAVPASATTLKLVLAAAGVIALGAVIYWGIAPGSGEHNVGPTGTARMKPNRRRSRRGKRKMRRNYTPKKKVYLTKKQALREFRHTWLPSLLKQYGPNDKTAIRTAWNDYVDYLSKDGSVRPDTDWTSPFR